MTQTSSRTTTSRKWNTRFHTHLIALLVLLLAAPLAAVHGQEARPDPVPVLVPEVINEYPHDRRAFTQGLLWHDGTLYESTGLRGESSLRQVEIETGEVLRMIEVRRPEVVMQGENPPDEYFAEGLERIGDRLIQLTWQAGEAFVYDLETFERLDTYEYEGEGWGLCYDGRYLYMSDGSPYISVRDAETFELVVKSLVTYQDAPIRDGLLNELECVGDAIYANLWQTDSILVLDKWTMQATHIIDASDLLSDPERARLERGRDVLNGIAYNPESDTFYITGKNWRKLFEVRFVPAEPSE